MKWTLIIWWESWPYSEGQQKKAVILHSFPDIIRGHSFRQGLDWQSGMHGAAFFFFGAGRGGAEEKNFGAGQGENARGRAG